MSRVVLTGPESTGKSTLVGDLANHFQCSYVNEYARTFISKLDRPYIQSDLIHIAKEQLNRMTDVNLINDILISDTDLLTIKIWSEYKYGNCDSFIFDSLKQNLPDLYLICYPDIEWQFDTQRENANNGLELFNIYLSEIESLEIPFKIIKGKGELRLTNAVKAVQEILF